ncbi:MAG: organomercurial lyase [Anaerolineae bacterium]
MNKKLENALTRLRHILPLKERQTQCSEEIKRLHQQILRSFVTKGRILTLEDMAQQVSDLAEAVDVLRRSDMVTFSEAGQPVGAYPFTMEERVHTIQVNGYQVHAMCALDALAISPMFALDTEINSRCQVTGAPIHIRQSGRSIENMAEASGVYFGIAWGAADGRISCADSLCLEMIFLRDHAIAQAWLAGAPESREVFTLPESVAFAEQFFVPLLA